MTMTEVTGVALDSAGNPLAGVEVSARLVAATYQLAAGGQVARDCASVQTDADGAWSLELTPSSEILAAESYYVIYVGDRVFYATVPDSGPVVLGPPILIPPVAPPPYAPFLALAGNALTLGAVFWGTWETGSAPTPTDDGRIHLGIELES